MFEAMNVSTLCRAIKERCSVQFWYSNKPRTFKPYVIHRSTQGNTLVSGYLVETGLKEDWRHFDLDKIDHLSLTNGTFEHDRLFSSFSGEYQNVTCAIDRH